MALALLATPAKDLALEHSIIHLISRTDRRIGNTVDGAIELLLAVMSSVVAAFVGLWFAFVVPRIIRRSGLQ